MSVAPQLFDAATTILDVRHHVHGEQIRGALRYNPNALLKVEKLVLPLEHEGQIVLCADDDESAGRIAGKLLDAGYTCVLWISGGMQAWKEAGLPTEPATEEQPVPGDSRAGIPLL